MVQFLIKKEKFTLVTLVSIVLSVFFTLLLSVIISIFSYSLSWLIAFLILFSLTTLFILKAIRSQLNKVLIRIVNSNLIEINDGLRSKNIPMSNSLEIKISGKEKISTNPRTNRISDSQRLFFNLKYKLTLSILDGNKVIFSVTGLSKDQANFIKNELLKYIGNGVMVQSALFDFSKTKILKNK